MNRMDKPPAYQSIERGDLGVRNSTPEIETVHSDPPIIVPFGM